MYNARATAYKIDDEKREGHMIFVCEQCAKKSQIGLSDPVAISIYSKCEKCGSFYGKELFEHTTPPPGGTGGEMRKIMKTTITKQETNAGITRLYGSDGRIYYPPRSASLVAQLRGRVFSRLLGVPSVHSVNKIPSSVGLCWSK